MNLNNKNKDTIIFNRCVLGMVIVMLLPACATDNQITTQEKVTTMLTSTEAWQSPIVTVDDVDYSDLYKDFTIKFNDGTYTSSGGAPVWAASGTWVFINEEATLMKLDNTNEVTIDSISDEFLELSLQWDQDTFQPGRSKSVKGKQKFKLKKK